MDKAKQKVEDWQVGYSTFRPHSCLGDLTPQMFIENQGKIANSSTLEKWEEVSWYFF